MKSKHVIPMVGPPAFDSQKTLCVNLEVYTDVERKTMYVQQRSNFVSGTQPTLLFAKALYNWLILNKFKRLYILAGVDNSFCRDAEIRQSSENLVYCIDRNSTTRQCNDENLVMPFEIQENSWKFTLRGAGIAAVLDTLCKNDEKLESRTLLRFVSEGDNVYDATVLAKVAAAELLDKASLVVPSSWEHMYGRREEGLY